MAPGHGMARGTSEAAADDPGGGGCGVAAADPGAKCQVVLQDVFSMIIIDELSSTNHG